jgi:hypothetical protein
LVCSALRLRYGTRVSVGDAEGRSRFRNPWHLELGLSVMGGQRDQATRTT